MAFARALAHLLAAPLVPLLAPRVTSQVDARIADGSWAEPADLKDAGLHLVHARRAMDELGTDLTALRGQADTIAARPRPKPANERIDEVVHALHAMSDRAAALRSALDAANTRIAVIDADVRGVSVKAEMIGVRVATAARPVAEEPPPRADICAVDGCEGSPRARGLCGRHYQLVRRGQLPGFVFPDGGVLLHDGTRIKVDPALQYQKATVVDGAVWVGGVQVHGPQ